jgi:hypothetical protein
MIYTLEQVKDQYTIENSGLTFEQYVKTHYIKVYNADVKLMGYERRIIDYSLHNLYN